MNDYFALLDEPRQPWLDPAGLKSRFFQLSSEVHPDRFHNAAIPDRALASQRYTALNTGYQCLIEPRERLRHLLELELGAPLRDVQRIPPGTMELFLEVGQRCREVDAFLADRARTSSPLLRVGLFQKSEQWRDTLMALQATVDRKQETLTADLEAMNSTWAAAPPVGTPHRPTTLPLAQLEQIYRLLSYLSRWTEQIQERLVQLAL